MGKFCEIYRSRHQGLDCTLLLDNLAVHHKPGPLLAAFDSNVKVQFLPPNTSHFLQPLDDKVFAIFKQQLATLATNFADALAWQGEKSTPLEIITAVSSIASKVAFKKQNIVESFANCDIWPFSPEKIRLAAGVNVGKVTPTVQEQPTIAELAAIACTMQLERENSAIQKVKSAARRVSMMAKYDQISSVE